MITKNRESIHIVPEPKRHELIQTTYGIIGCMQEVHNQLGPGLPEYIYQEALTKQLIKQGLTVHKEYQFHPTFNGEPLEAYLKMDLVIESPVGNIIVECKAITQLSEREHYQTFGYLRATKFPIAILVNFGTERRAQIERYHYFGGKLFVF